MADEESRSRELLGPNLRLWVLTAAVALLFSPTLRSLLEVWLDSADYQHGFIVALVSIWLLVRSRSELHVAKIEPNVFALLPLGMALVAWLVAYRGHSEMLQQVLFPIVLLLSVLASLGFTFTRLVAFPILYFYCAIPVWDHLVPLLQSMSTHVTEGTLGLLGVPTEVEGFNVTIPEGKFSIVEGCSGKRYFLISIALAAIAGYTQGVRGRRFVVLLTAAAVAALLTNWIRIVIVIYAGHLSNMQHYLIATEHLSLGYALYVPLLLFIFVLAKRWAMFSPALERATIGSADKSKPFFGLFWSLAPPLSMILLAITVMAVSVPPTDSHPLLARAPLLTDQWQGPLPAREGWQPAFSGASDELRMSYAREKQRLEIYANVYGPQVPGRELVYFSNSIVPAAEWTVIRHLETASPLETLIARRDDLRWVFASTHVVGGRRAATSAMAQLTYGWSALWEPTPAGVIALGMPCGNDCEATAATLIAFWSEHGDALTSMIPRRL
jgi:EpsI family protein